MHHHVGSVLYRTDHIRCAERVVHNQWHVMTVSHLSHGVYVRHARVRVAEGLHEHSLRVLLNRCLQSSQVVHLHDRVRDAQVGKRVGDQII